jgi:hypothetical protein
MIFGRRKHAAPAPVAPAPATPELTDELVFAAVQRSLAQVFGEHGDWTVARRSDDQTDTIFHDILVHSLATTVTASISAARDASAEAHDVLAGGPLGLLRAPRIEAPAAEAEADADVELDAEDEPAALRWEPAPITRWADLKRPVTGPVAVIDEGKAA